MNMEMSIPARFPSNRKAVGLPLNLRSSRSNVDVSGRRGAEQAQPRQPGSGPRPVVGGDERLAKRDELARAREQLHSNTGEPERRDLLGDRVCRRRLQTG